MDIKQSLDYRIKEFKKYTFNNNNKYDYESEGILQKILPKILFKGNSIFVTFLQLIDLRIIIMFKYIDKLYNFKHITKF